ncbi:MAG: class I SAM-dependent methyltransferase [Verrucomicrobiales bacterium]|jgi:SAM-dependent methyltransferase|nr:class I SAM-dependent methyltransferase [Verrucomicrobiales bacterium]MDB3940250.1 class I SAM-dependent methyltransferase [Verrucomicrobiales bacterium]
MSAKFRSEDEEDLIRLKKMLRKVLGDDEAQVRRRLESRDETRILDIACGECREAEVLTDFIADLRGNKDGEVRLTGMDVRAREIEDAQRRFGGKRDLENRPGTRECEFLTGDASKLDQHAELGENFDFVFMRHQNYWNGAKTWEEIYDQALGKLDDEGRLIITSYFDKEHELALEAIKRLGGELISSEFNSETRELITEGKSVDRHVAIFKRKK